MSARSYYRLGRCAAALHKASPSFRPGNDFQILTNDRVFYWDKETILSPHDRTPLPKPRQLLFQTGTKGPFSDSTSKQAVTRVNAGPPFGRCPASKQQNVDADPAIFRGRPPRWDSHGKRTLTG